MMFIKSVVFTGESVHQKTPNTENATRVQRTQHRVLSGSHAPRGNRVRTRQRPDPRCRRDMDYTPTQVRENENLKRSTSWADPAIPSTKTKRRIF